MEYGIFYSHIKAAAENSPDPASETLRLCRKMKERGIKGVTVNVKGFTDADLDIVSEAGLRVDTAFCVCDMIRGEYAEDPHIRRAARLGAGIFMIIPGFIENGAPSDAEAKAAAYPLLRRAAKTCRDLGMRAAMEDYGGALTPYNTPGGMLDFYSAAEDLELVFDSGNFLYFGIDPLEAYGVLKGKFIHVHAKDLSLSPLPGSPRVVSPTGRVLYPAAVGDGEAAKALAALIKDGYDGILTLEYDGKPDLTAFVDRSLSFLESAG